jgi:hypothetical protein
MKVTISDGKAYVNCVYLCLVEAGNDRISLRPGNYPLTTQFSHGHGDVLPNADGAGWIGASRSCDIVLGGVRGRGGLVPSKSFVVSLLAKIEVEEGLGRTPILEILP